MAQTIIKEVNPRYARVLASKSSINKGTAAAPAPTAAPPNVIDSRTQSRTEEAK